jgi:hypothetical protein
MKCFPLMLQETGNYVSWLTVCVSALRTLKSIAGPRDWFCCNKESLQGCWRMSVPSEDNGRAQVKSLRGSLRCWDQSSWTLTHIEVWAMSTSISWGRWTVGKPNTEYAPQYLMPNPSSNISNMAWCRALPHLHLPSYAGTANQITVMLLPMHCLIANVAYHHAWHPSNHECLSHI